MTHRWHVPVIMIIIVALIGIGTAAQHPISAQTTGSPPANASPVNCTVWRASASAPLGPEQCAESPPWWTVWGNCPVTPVHGEPGSEAEGLSRLPWVQAEPASARVVGFLYFGDRPLHTRGQFPDGASGKVLWQFDYAVSGLTITATKLDSQHAPIILLKAQDETSMAAQWPSNMAIPTPGCWHVNLTAQGQNGPVKATVTFIVVE